MPISRESEVPSGPTAGRSLLAAAGLVLLVALAYWGSLTAPFQFDDEPAVVYNRSIHSWVTAIQPPADGAGVTGRPLVNITFAANYATGGLNPWGYHAVNLAIHAAAALLLAGILRRAFDQVPDLGGSWTLAWTIAALWAVHPLQTESVTNVVQRAESLVSLCYLLTLYGFIRGVTAEWTSVAGWRKPEVVTAFWLGVSVVACLLGMASKEVMVSAPLVVFLYDRTFIAGSFREAWSAHWRYYVALAATWLLLAWLVIGTQGRGGSAGFSTEMSSWRYLLTQCDAIVHYLSLVVWPHPLVLDYGTPLMSSLGQVWWQAVLLVAVFAGAGWSLARRPVVGFLGITFFALLAPSSSFIPVATQTMAEHRMYLALAVVLTGLGVALWRGLGRNAWYVFGALAVGWVVLTVRRNADYQDAARLWTQTVSAVPTNPRAHLNLGQVQAKAGQWADAEGHFAEAARLKPDYAEAHYNLGLALSRRRALPEAIEHFETALKLSPDYVVVRSDLGIAYADAGRMADALTQLETAVKERPDFAGAYFNLGNLFMRTGRKADAIESLEAAVRLNGAVAEYHASLGVALMQSRRVMDAVKSYQRAVKLMPKSPELRLGLGLTLAASGRLREAVAPLEEALRLKPDFAPAQHYLNQVRADLSRLDVKR